MNPNERKDDGLVKMRHTAAHLLAQAVLEMYPQAKLGIGPPIDEGFYYDFDLGLDDDGALRTFQPDDLPKLEKRMRQIIQGKHELVYEVITAVQACHLFANQPYKLELLADFAADEVISIYRHDSFVDLCRGPHVAHTGEVPAAGLKLMQVAGAYWRGDAERPMLQRIYGTVWPDKKGLKAYLQRLEEARQRDHRKIGRELELFLLDEEIGPGLPLWLPNGNVLREELEKLAREVEDAAGYQRVSTPHLAKEALFQRSGHLPYYEADMYPPMVDGETRYFLRPMNCPFHHKIYGRFAHSYRDLPIRLSEWGMVYRYEQSGSLMGLMRVRGAQQNDAHIYCSAAQFEAEFMAVIDLYKQYFDLFGIETYVMRLSKHAKSGLGKKYVDNEPMWLKMEAMIRDVLLRNQVPFVEVTDEAAFYGPKIDVQVWSAIGREFSLATNQVDFVQPERFNLAYIDENGQSQVPLCIHRAPLGSHERFIGFLIEHYAGAFPVWLAPEQVRVIPITDDHHDYAESVRRQLRAAGMRIRPFLDNDRMNAQIRDAQRQKVPYMLIVGDQEVASGTVAVRQRDGVRRQAVKLADWIAQVKNRIQMRANGL